MWSSECQQAFEQLKCKLISAPVLAYPNYQDASVECLGPAVPDRYETSPGGIRQPSSEKRYRITELETLAVV